MSVPEQPVPDWWQRLYPRRVLERAWRLLAPRQWPGWLLFIAGAFVLVPDFVDRIKFWIEIIESMGGWSGHIAGVIVHPYFGWGLIASGLAYVILIGPPDRLILRQHWWPYVGWSVAALCTTAIVATAAAGAIQVYIRTQIVERQVAVLRGNDLGATTQAPDPSFDYARQLSPDQVRALMQAGERLKPFTTDLSIAIAPRDNEAFQYRQRFLEAFTRAGLRALEFDIYPDGPTEVGVMIAVADKSSPPAGAEELRRILEVVGVSSRYVQRSMPNAEIGFILFIGPKPI